jgi:hypothetical protein
MPLPARLPGSLALFVQNRSQTQTFSGEVVEGNTGAGTCLVRISGSRVQTCEVGTQVTVSPGDKVNCVRLPGRARLVVTPLRAAISMTTIINNSVTRTSGGGGNDPGDPVPLTAPTDLTAEATGNTTILLAWTCSGVNILSYYIEISQNGTDFSPVGSCGVESNSYEVQDLTPATGYTFRVRAANTRSLSAYSNTAYAQTLDDLTTPTDLEAVAIDGHQIDLTWTLVNESEDGYSIEWSLDGEGFSELDIVTAEEGAYSANGCDSNTTYYFRIRCWRDSTWSGYSNTADATTYTVPDAPTNLALTVVGGVEIDLVWIDNTDDELHYQIERSLDGESFDVIATIAADLEAYADVNCQPATLYYYRVCAVGVYGNSSYSNVESDTTLSFGGSEVLDDFNLEDGPLGTDWTGETFFFEEQPLDTRYPAVIRDEMFAVNVAYLYGSAYWNTSLGPDCEVCATINAPATGEYTVEVAVRGTPVTDSLGHYLDTYYMGVAQINCATGTATVYVFDRYEGIMATASGLTGWGDGDIFGVHIKGSSIGVYRKAAAGSWSLIVSTTDSSYSGSGKVMLGIRGEASDFYLDNFRAVTL